MGGSIIAEKNGDEVDVVLRESMVLKTFVQKRSTLIKCKGFKYHRRMLEELNNVE